jgi:hypothetical protein
VPPRRRELLPRERDDVLRERVAPLRAFVVPVAFFAAGLRAVVERLAPLLDDFVREALVFFAVLRLAVLRLAVERLADDLGAPLGRDEPELVLALVLPSIVHLPDMTRCAASATASAISEPNLVALAMTLLAA